MLSLFSFTTPAIISCLVRGWKDCDQTLKPAPKLITSSQSYINDRAGDNSSSTNIASSPAFSYIACKFCKKYYRAIQMVNDHIKKIHKLDHYSPCMWDPFRKNNSC